MAFYNHWHCKFAGIKGFVNLYEDGLKYRMLTAKAKDKVFPYSFNFLWVLTDSLCTNLRYCDVSVPLTINPDEFNRRLIDYLIFYNLDRVRFAFRNKLSPVQFMIQWQERQLFANQLNRQNFKIP